MPLPFHYSRVKPQGPYTGGAWVRVPSSPSLQQEPSLRSRLRVQGTRVIVDLHDTQQTEEASKMSLF